LGFFFFFFFLVGRPASRFPLRRIQTELAVRRVVADPPAASRGVTRASECCERLRYRAVWVPCARHDVTAFAARLHGPRRRCPPQLLHRGFILSCALRSPSESLEHCPPDASQHRAPSLGFRPPSRHQPAESTCDDIAAVLASIPGPLRSVLGVSHALDGFLLHRSSWACFIPQPRPGFALQGFPLPRSRASSTPASALLPLRRLPAPSFTHGLQSPTPAYRALLSARVRCDT
jgi:hypothetical protein